LYLTLISFCISCNESSKSALLLIAVSGKYSLIYFISFLFAVFNNSNIFGFVAIFLAAINIFGGFLVTQRMLQMYKKKKKDK